MRLRRGGTSGGPEAARVLVECTEGLHGHQAHGFVDTGPPFEGVCDQSSGEALSDAEGLVVVVVSTTAITCSAHVAESNDLGVVRAVVIVDLAHAGSMQCLQHDQGPACLLYTSDAADDLTRV